ncbi:MAG TPA: MBL fold metallo-hydrolase [Alphaproteobacteria bacterium]|nr:MBL fold metallo-hydrolase [Alphaproteobacteria bacterium]
MRLSFLGAAGTVTGSKYLIDTGEHRLLVDCGLFQGFKTLRLKNWAPLPVRPESIDTVVLTHAHIDHSGYLPLLARHGFRGKVICTDATFDLCKVLLPDSGFLQERDAEFANKHGFSKHRPALPLYTELDAQVALKHFTPVTFDEDVSLPGGLTARFRRGGHILGAAIVELWNERRRIVFSGDLGRPDNPVMPDPTPIPAADYLVVESTYGDRRHPTDDPEALLAKVVNRTAGRGGTVLIPAFAVGRSQLILYHLHRLKQAGRIPADLPVYLDSPMAIDASEIFRRHPEDHRLSAQEATAVCRTARYVHTAEESKVLDQRRMPMVLISASGMATGGRVLHHLKHFAPDRRATILFTGFQAGGTRGASLVGGAQRVKIHGDYVPVRAEVLNLTMLSAHADADEIMGWLRHFEVPPRRCFVTHGEPPAADALRHRIEEELGWPCLVPEQGQRVGLR